VRRTLKHGIVFLSTNRDEALPLGSLDERSADKKVHRTARFVA
jgi:hypothetical protein